MEALLGFAQVDDAGRPAELPGEGELATLPAVECWQRLHERLQKLLRVR